MIIGSGGHYPNRFRQLDRCRTPPRLRGIYNGGRFRYSFFWASRYDTYGIKGLLGETRDMNQGDGTGRLHKQRQGVCHRCGWSGPVAKVGRGDRKRLKIGRSYGRLCSECTDDLIRSQSTSPRAQGAGRAKSKAVRDRNVA